MSGLAARDEFGDRWLVLGIVEDQQPLAVGPQPPPHRLDHDLLVGLALLLQIQLPRQGRVVTDQRPSDPRRGATRRADSRP